MVSGGLQCRVDFAVLFEPFDVAALGMLLHLAQQLHRLWFKTHLAGISVWDQCFEFDRDDIIIGSHQSSSLYSFACQTHSFTSQKVYRHQFGVVY